ncbi:iron hydrogenase small subunit [Desulfocurvus sp.]|jgi:ferredoxin hydrogenase small subunit|uniref:iron hydrogenase small subunit n=1 Tax=Desulfocurvus sp. TaxID=2871698 RepID=UPI0025C22487|nr:iron hydrogenase small subunit [Desulfocurvus sp.]MCK9239056.1 iron hydrogenase small subunit [Desulfocurvus sp.]
MRIVDFTRRQFLKVGCIGCAGMLVSLRFTARAIAAAKDLKGYMLDRINGVYAADAAFKFRASQDNPQVITLYKSWLEEPMSHKAEQFLHMHWTDRSKGLKKLRAEGAYPNPRAAEFDGGYPYE